MDHHKRDSSRMWEELQLVVLIAIALMMPRPTNGFSRNSPLKMVTPSSAIIQHHPFLIHYYRPLLAGSFEQGMEEYEAARQEFEQLLFPSDSLISPQRTPLPRVKPLTSSTRRIMELELELLAQLEDSNDVVDPLVELWTAERADAAKELQMMELGNCSPGLVREEELLRAMIQQYGSEWVEPMSRLAVLLFTKRRVVEAMDLVRRVLDIKPWHFEAGQLLVVMLLREGDYKSALRAARAYTLPNLNESTQHRRRKRWVREKVRRAHELFQQALESTTTLAHPDVTNECTVDEPFCWQ